ncbi:U4/U6.U5 small nuclear ribonucleoprotein component [Candida viswanathii]|uniref:U4/U6.U5 small nuclear ribonucleoprotein component n=1 Tax=Candida viswanathii TaxID=5486 RepID=A0A367YH38_9ASCO|nr:U4/U6.U5 small nuclear ribonucleoprotein component [Candida viswanathii]
MSEEISLSLEETNELRLKAGLKPIPVPAEQRAKEDDDVISLSLEETNKLRAQVGLPLIPVASSHKDTEVENFDKHQKEVSNKQKNEELLQRINDAKFKSNKRKIIGDDTLVGDSKEVDTDEWLLKITNDEETKPKKKQKAMPRKDEETLAVICHSAKELRNIGDNEILTLADSALLDDEDVLTSETLSRNAKLKKDLAERNEAESIKFRGRHYKKNNDEEDEEDEEDDGVLLGSGKVIINKNTVTLPEVKKSEEEKNTATFTNLFDEIDELEEKKPKSVVKMKKIKKKKGAKSSRKTDSDERVTLIPVDDDIDDPEYDISLMLSRSKKLQSRDEFTPEKLAEEIAANRRWEFERTLERESLTENVYDDTTGFLNNLENNLLDDEDKHEEEVNGESHTNGKFERNGKGSDNETDTTPKFSGGLADTLKFLKSRNIIGTQTNTSLTKAQELERQEASKKSELLKMKISIEERILKEELAKDKKYIRMPKADKASHFEKLLDKRLHEKGIVIKEENLKVYNPKVELTYKDDSGNVLDRKKAWKEFSHKYHGTGLDKKKK